MQRLFAALVLAAIYMPAAAASDPPFFGPLRARDLTPFGYLRLDMRPSYAVSLSPGAWAIETRLAYQNTWAVSPEVEDYLNALPGRRELGPDEWQAIRDLPGENYLVDVELAQLDVTLHRQLSEHWGAYVVLSGAAFGGGFLDATIEGFHDAFGFGPFGRPAAARNDVNVLFDLKSAQFTAFESPSSGGLLDPVFGARYSRRSASKRWQLVLESAVKVPVAGRRTALSSGRTDFGVQASVHRFWESQALFLNVAVVSYAGMQQFVPEPAQIVPTLVLGYERRLAPRTNAIIQGYVSPSVYEHKQTDLDELLGTKYELSVGIRHRMNRHLFTVAVTENVQNINNTPDIGFQFGWAFVPEWRVGGR